MSVTTRIHNTRGARRIQRASYAHNIYCVNTKTRVLCDPIMRSREQTSRSDQMMTVIGEMTVIFIFGAATLAALYTIHAVTFGGV